MNVELIDCTKNAKDILIFTKSTRLDMTPDLGKKIGQMSNEEKLAELEYMANTIPSSWEFVSYTFLVTGVSRAYTHQQVRTRAGSYAQQTMRVTNQCDYDFVYPEKIANDAAGRKIVDGVNEAIKAGYRELLAYGYAPEDARCILPTNIATNIVCKFNLRTLAELAASRTGGRTQSEYQNVLRGMVDAVLAVHPWAEKFLFKQDRNYFDDIEAFAEKEFGGDLLKKGALLKIVDKMRKEKK